MDQESGPEEWDWCPRCRGMGIVRREYVGHEGAVPEDMFRVVLAWTVAAIRRERSSLRWWWRRAVRRCVGW